MELPDGAYETYHLPNSICIEFIHNNKVLVDVKKFREENPVFFEQNYPSRSELEQEKAKYDDKPEVQKTYKLQFSEGKTVRLLPLNL